MKLTRILLLSLFLCSTFGHAAASSDTDAYIAALAQLLEQKTIGDAELVTLFEAAEDGKVVNPISPVRADTSVEHFAASNALEELLDAQIDAARVAAWTSAKIKEQERILKKRKQTEDATKKLLKAETSVLSPGLVHACALTTDGIIKCWGSNSNGKTKSPSGVFQSVSSGSSDTCGVRIDGAVVCWGSHFHGHEKIRSGGFRSISLNDTYICGLKFDGTVECWNVWDNGTKWPTRPPGVFQSISTGTFHACGINLDGAVECWGNNAQGQTKHPTGIFQSVSAGSFHTCGVRVDGDVECWGHNESGQSKAPTGAFQSVSAGTWHTCGVRTDGIVECWGKGNWITSDPPSGAFRSVFAGERFNCAMRLNGAVECWGDNRNCQTTPPRSLRYPWLASYFDIDWTPAWLSSMTDATCDFLYFSGPSH